ncbi:hypothetical protein L0F63_001536, partial [Massospora cicadina]
LLDYLVNLEHLVMMDCLTNVASGPLEHMVTLDRPANVSPLSPLSQSPPVPSTGSEIPE